MLDYLLNIERDLFLCLNGIHTSFFDQFFWLYSGKIIWLPVAVCIIVLLSYKRDWREVILVLLALVLTVTLCDQFASHVCKPLFARYRPTHHPDFMNDVKIVFGYRGGLYGFISSHAANAFGVVTFLALLFRNKLLTFFLVLWAVLNSYSRIYLGVHFISDVFFGALSGVMFGWLVYKLFVYLRSRYDFLPEHKIVYYDSNVESWRPLGIVLVLILTHCILTIIAYLLCD